MANTTVDTLLVKIKADMSSLEKELGKVRKSTDGVRKETKKSFSAIGFNFRTLVTGVVAVSALHTIKSLVSVASAAEEMQGKSSVVFGQFTQDFRNFASELATETGRSKIELEGMGASIQDLFVPLGFSRQEATELSKSLTKLAVDVGSFNDVSDPEVMRAFQSALIGNHEAVRRFGVIITEASLKQELLTMGVTKNVNEVDNQTKVQARMNILFKGTADAQGDAVRTAGSFANRSRALQSAIKDLSVDIGATLLPTLGNLFNEITTKVVPAFREFAMTIGLIDPTMAEEIQDVTNRVTELGIQLLAVNDKRAARTLKNELKEASEELLRLQNIRTRELEKQRKEADKQAEKDKKIELAKKESEAQTKLNEVLMDAESIIEGNKTEQEKLNEQILIFEEALTNVAEKDIPKVQEALTILKEDLKELDPLMKEITQIFDRASDSISQAIADSITEGKNLMESLKDITRNVVNQMIAEFLRLQVIKPLMGRIFGGMGGSRGGGGGSNLLSSLLGGLFTFGGAALAPSTGGTSLAVGGGLSSAFAGMRPFAGGGSVAPNRAVMVGERGPEIFVPNSGGKIVPNHNMKSLGGQETVINQNINITTGVSQTVRAEVLNMLPAIKQETLQAVADSRLRGGTFGAAFTR